MKKSFTSLVKRTSFLLPSFGFSTTATEKTRFGMGLSKLRLLSCLLLLTFCEMGWAQCPNIQIVDLRDVPGFPQANNLNVCGEPDTLSLLIFTDDPGEIKGFEMTVNMVQGMRYAGFEDTHYGGCTDISNADPDINSPVFIANGITCGDIFVANIGVTADCTVDIVNNDYVLEVEYEYVYFPPTGGAIECKGSYTLDNDFNSSLKESVLNMFTPSPIDVTVTGLGTPACQTLTISQDGLQAYVNEFQFAVCGLDIEGTSPVSISSMTANGIDILAGATYNPADTSITTTIDGTHFPNNGSPNPADERMNTNEKVTVEICYEVANCPEGSDIPFAYKAWYGCFEEICQTTGQGSFLKVRPTGSMLPDITASLDNGITICGSDATVTTTIENPNTDTEQNVYTDVSLGFQACGLEQLIITEVTINGENVPPLYMVIGDDIDIDLSMNTNPNIGLVDYDGDGFFDDLPGGAAPLNVTVKFNLACGVGGPYGGTDCPVINCENVQFYFKGKTNCGNAFRGFPSTDGFNLLYGQTAASNPTEIDLNSTGSVVGYDFGKYSNDGAPIASRNSSTQEVTFCFDFGKENIEECPSGPDTRFVVQLAGPPTVIPDFEFVAGSAMLSTDGGTSYSAVADSEVDYVLIDDSNAELTINAGTTDAQLCYKYQLELDTCLCLPIQYIAVTQQVISTCTDCEPDCDLVKGCRNTLFKVDPECTNCECLAEYFTERNDRTNFGYTDKTMTTRLTRDEVPVEDLRRYMPGDTLEHWGHVEFYSEEVFNDPAYWSFVWALYPLGGSYTTAQKLPLSMDAPRSVLDEISVENPDGTMQVVDLSSLAGCMQAGTREVYNSYVSNFGDYDWIDHTGDGRVCHNSFYNSFDGYDNNYLNMRFYNYDRIQECNNTNPAIGNRADWGDGDCLTEFIDAYNLTVGSKLYFKFRVPLIKNPYRAQGEILGLAPAEDPAMRIFTSTQFYQVDDIAGGTLHCQSLLGAACRSDEPFFGSCPGDLYSKTDITLDNCGGSIKHTFAISDFAGPPGDPWFTAEYRPLIELHDISLPIFSPLAYCANAKVIRNGVETSITVDSVENMSCSPVSGYNDDLCAVDAGNKGYIVFDLFEQGIQGLGIGLDNCDTLCITYDFCMTCPAPIEGLLDYDMLIDWCFTGHKPDECTIGKMICTTGTAGFRNNSYCDDAGLASGTNYYNAFMLDTLYCKQDVPGGIVFVDDSAVTPTDPVTATNNGTNLLASGSPGSSIEIQPIEFCNTDAMDATGFLGYVSVPSSVTFMGACADAAGNTPLTTALVSDDGVLKKYSIDVGQSTLTSGECIEIYIKTTLLFCPLPGSLPPEICVGATSGCAPDEVRAALGGGGDACSGTEVCYAYIFGEAGIQSEWFSLPTEINLCEPFMMNIRIKNVKALTLLNLEAAFDLPAGLSVIPGSWEVAYPGGAVNMTGNFGAWTGIPDPDVVSGDNYTYSDDALWNSFIDQNGLVGVTSSLDSNNVAFRFQVTTDCDEFLSGSRAATETQVSDPCGLGNLSSGEVASPPLIVAGANPADHAQLLTVANPEALYCGGLVNTFGLTALNISDYPTTDSVLACITIPTDDLDYVPGSIMVTNPAGFVPTYMTDTQVGTDRIICMNVPPIPPGASIGITFGAEMKESSSCGDIMIGADVKSVVEAVTCTPGPPNMCDVFVQNSINPGIFIERKPPLETADLKVYSDCSNGDDPVQVCYEVTLVNPGPQYDGTVRIGIHDDVTANSILDAFDTELNGMDHTVSLGTGDTAIIMMCLDVPAIQSCPIIINQTYETTCACDNEATPITNLPPAFIATLEECIVLCPGMPLELETCGNYDITLEPAEGGTVTDDGSGMTSIALNAGFGVETPVKLVVSGTQGECPMMEMRELKSIGDWVPTNQVAEICEDDCVDLDLLIPDNIVGGATITWSPTLGLDDPTSATPEVCNLTANQVYNVEIKFGESCVFNIDYTVLYNPKGVTTITGEEFCLCYELGTLEAPAGFDSYEWYSIQSGVEIKEQVTTTNTWNGPAVAGDYFVKAYSEKDLCPFVSEVYTLTTKECVDLELTKGIVNIPSPLTIGSQVTYEIVVCNIQDDSLGLKFDATNVQVSDELPGTVTYVQHIQSSGNYSPTTNQWDISVVESGTCDTLWVDVTLDDYGSIENTAQVTGSDNDDIDSTPNNDDGDQSEDEEDNAIIMVDTFDLALTKKLSPLQTVPVTIGSTVTYDIEVCNQGTIDAYNVEVVDYVPTGMMVTDPNWTTGSVADEYFRTIQGPITPGMCTTVQLVTTITAIPPNGSYTNHAEISTAEDVNGDTPPDIDSSPDNDPANDGPVTDDTVDNSSGDEDDHDPAVIPVVEVECEIASNSDLCPETPLMMEEIGMGNTAWSWSGPNNFSSTLKSNTIMPAVAGTYMVTVTDANGLTGVCQTEIGIFPVMTISTNLTNASCDTFADGSIDLTVVGGTGPFQFDWSNDGPDAPDDDPEDIANLAAGTYMLTVTDANGCMIDTMFTITEPPALTCTTTPTHLTCNGDASGTIAVTAAGGTGTYEYSLDGGPYQPGASFTGLAGGAYEVTVKDANGCTTMCMATVTEPEALTCELIALTPESCTFNDGSIEVSATGGTGAITYSIDGGTTTQTTGLFAGLTVGNYTITLEDESGCTATCEYEILPDCYDLALVKTLVTPGPYSYGQNVVFEIEVFNQGNIDATNVEITDHIACGFTYNPGVLTNLANDWTPLATTFPMTDIASIPAQTSQTVQIELTITECTDIGGHINEAEISKASDENGAPITDVDSTPDYDPNNDAGGNPSDSTDNQLDGNGTDDEDDHDPALVPIYDLALTKTLVTPATYAYGDTLEFAIEVCNQASNPVMNIAVSDYVPVGYSYDASLNTGWVGSGPTPTTLTYTYTTPLLYGAECTTIPLFLVMEMAGGTDDWKNVSEISSFEDEAGDPQTDVDSTPDDNPTNDGVMEDDATDGTNGDEDDSDFAGPEVVDIALVKTTSDTGPFTYGDVVTFDIKVYNQGNIDLYNAVVNDFVPCGYKYLPANDTDWTYDAGTSVATTTVAGPILPGDSITVSIQVEVQACPSDPSGGWTNVSEVASFQDGNGEDRTEDDIDSTGDDDPTNDVTTDNTNDNLNVDEDDNDPETIGIFDLAQIKEIVTPSPYAYGDKLEYKITVVNQGNIDATNINITDHLPTGLSFDAADNPDWDATNAPDYTYAITTLLEPGDTFCIPYFATLEMTTGDNSNYTNISEITSSEDGNGNDTSNIDADSSPDADPTNDAGGEPNGDSDNQFDGNGTDDEDDNDLAIVEVFDLALKKTTSATGPFSYGDTITFDFTVYNQGNIPSTNIEITEQTPCGYSLIPALNPQWLGTGSTATTTITDTLQGGDSTIVSVAFLIEPCYEAVDNAWKNTGEISASEDDMGNDTTNDDIDSFADGDPSNDGDMLDNDTNGENGDEDDSDFELIEIFDLAQKKTIVTASPYAYGDTITYAITVYNQGNVNATNIEVTDFVPAGLQFDPALNTHWTGSAPSVTTLITDTLSTGDSSVVNIQLILLPNAGGIDDYTNIAEISSSEDDMGNDTSGDDIDSTPDTDPTNDPGGEPNGDSDDQVDGNGTDDEDDNDPATIEVFDLALKKTTNNVGPFAYGDVITFDFTVYNQGNIASTNIEVTDYIPCGYLFDPILNPDWMLFGTAAKFNITDTLQAGDSTIVSIELVLQPCDEDGAWKNVAEISGSEDDMGNDTTNDDIDSFADDDPTNDGAMDDNMTDGTNADEDDSDYDDSYDEDDSDPEVVSIFDLAQIKELVTPGPYNYGDTLRYAITVVNQGNIPATNIVVTDYLPTGLTYDAALNPTWAGAAPTVTHTITDTLQMGDTAVVYIDLILTQTTGGNENYTNTSEITSSQDDKGNDTTNADADDDDGQAGDNQNETDNSFDDGDDDRDTAPLYTFDLALTKTTSDTGPFKYGDIITFDFTVYNQGNIPATNIEITEQTPCGYQFDSALNPDWLPLTDGTATTVIGDTILAGDSTIVSVVFVIEPCEEAVDNAWRNTGEISRSEDDMGNDTTNDDIDSNADGDPSNDGDMSDNDTNGENGDEDDSDFELIEVFDLALMKTKVGPITMDGKVTFNITVINQGNVDAYAIGVIDYPVTGLNYFSGTNGTVTTANGNTTTITDHADGNFDISHLAVGDTVVIEYVTQINMMLMQNTIRNWAEITGADNDTDPTNEGPTDADSTPDDDPFNGDGETDDFNDDNVTDNSNGDEDDHDGAEIRLPELDPLGTIYCSTCEEDGKIITGGTISVEPAEHVIIIKDGSDGTYQWFTDGTPGRYTMTYNHPNGYPLSYDCLPQPGPFDPTGTDGTAIDKDGVIDMMVSLGTSDTSGGYLTNYTCTNNPYYLEFDLGFGDPFINHNNLPIACGQLASIVCDDADGDGIPDTDAGIAGVLTRLYACDDLITPIDAQFTNSNGEYNYDGLAAGCYVIQFVLDNDDTFVSNDFVNEDGWSNEIAIDFGQCEDQVSVCIGKNDPDPTARILDPCTCIGNGFLQEKIVIYSAFAGEQWSLTQNTGMYATSSTVGNLIPISIGATATYVGTENGLHKYEMDLIHLENVGYSAIFNNGLSILSIANTCDCPNTINDDPDATPGVAVDTLLLFNGSKTHGESTLDHCDGTIFTNSIEEHTHYVDTAVCRIAHTICPQNQWQRLTYIISRFDLAAGDTLCVFQGKDTLGVPAAKWSGNGVSTTGGWISSECSPEDNASGCLTFLFKTNGDNSKGTGFSGKLTCEDRGIDISAAINNGKLLCDNPLGWVEFPAPTIEAECDPVENLGDVEISLVIKNQAGDFCGAQDTLVMRLSQFPITLDLGIGAYTAEYFLTADPVKTTHPMVFSVTPPSLVCNDELNVAMNSACGFSLSADDLLENPCPETDWMYYEISLVLGEGKSNVVLTGSGSSVMTGSGSNIDEPLIHITKEHLAEAGVDGCSGAVDVKIERIYYENGVPGMPDCNTIPVSKTACTTTINFEDKTSPVVSCHSVVDTLVTCDTIGLAALLHPVAIDNCDDDVAITYSVELEENGPCWKDNGSPDTTKAIVTFTAIDDCGNTGTCTKEVILLRPTTFIIPSSVELACDDLTATPTERPSVVIGYKSTNGFVPTDTLPLNEDDYVCGYLLTKELITTPANECGAKTFIDWSVLDWCNAEVSPIGRQFINYKDTLAPAFAVDTLAPTELFFGAHDCQYDATLLTPPVATDNCSEPLVRLAAIDRIEEGETWAIGESGWTSLDADSFQLTWVAEDLCHEQLINDTLTQIIVLKDQTLPTAVCIDALNISLSRDSANIHYSNIDGGSNDACGIVNYELSTDQENWSEYLSVKCEHLHEPITVHLRVTDAGGNSSTCWMNIQAEDKIPPICEPLADASGTCTDGHLGQFGATTDTDGDKVMEEREWVELTGDLLAAYNTNFGNPICSDNLTCQEPVIEQQYQLITNSCGRMDIQRRYRGIDWDGEGMRSNWMIQHITVNYEADWAIDLPMDWVGDCGQSIPEATLAVENGTCDAVSFEVEEQVFTIAEDACMKVVRTYRIFNWCHYRPNQEAVLIDRIEANGKVTAIQQIRPTDTIGGIALADAGLIQYVQILKLQDTEAPTVVPGPQNSCLEECEETRLFSAVAVDCNLASSEQVRFRWELMIEGEAIADGTGNEFEWAVQANTAYQIVWTARDACGNTTKEEVTYEFIDCKQPTAYCLHGISVDLMPTGMVPIWAEDLDVNSADNCPNAEIQFRMWHNSLAVNPPTNAAEVLALPANIIFTCAHLGTQEVQMYVIDQSNNWDFCTGYINIQDNNDACPTEESIDPTDNTMATIAGKVYSWKGEAIERVDMETTVGNYLTETDGDYHFEVPKYQDYTIVPSKDINPLNGVSTFDLVLISKHILGIEKFSEPYQWIAADANRSKTVTAFDMVQIRRLILAIDDSFSNNTSWRFVEGDYSFQTDQPLTEDFPEVGQVNQLTTDQIVDFIGVKIGDVNGNAQPNSLQESIVRTSPATFEIEVEEQAFKAGHSYEVTFSTKQLQQVQGYQFTLNLENVRVDKVKGELLQLDNFGLQRLNEGQITTSWNHAIVTGEQLMVKEDNDQLFTLQVMALQDVQLSEVLSINHHPTTAEAYDENGDLMEVEFRFTSPSEQSVFELYQNEPNPFQGMTTIGYTLPDDSETYLVLRDETGRVLQVMKQEGKAGSNQFQIRELDLPSGFIYYQLATKFGMKSKKMLRIE